MRRLLTASALLVLAVFTATAVGQPQPGGDVKPKAADDKKADKKVADPTDAVIAAALANDPDVKMARAKIQLAEAELAKARLAIAQKVTFLKTTIDQQKAVVEIVTKQYTLVEHRANAGTSSNAELLEARIALLKAQAVLATSEAEWKLLTGGAAGVAAADPAADKVVRLWAGLDDVVVADDAERLARRLDAYRAVMLQARAAVKGPIPDRIRAALDKPVKLAEKGHSIQFHEVIAAFKTVGQDVPVRENQKAKFALVTSQGEELPIGAWLQLFLDETPGTVMVVREYGILVVDKANAPPDAPTVFDFWKQKPAAKEPAPKK